MEYFKSLFLMLMPGYVEIFLTQFENSGNMGLYGVFLDIYIKRNWLYFSTGVLIVSYPCNFVYYGFLFYLGSELVFLHTFNKWSKLIVKPS